MYIEVVALCDAATEQAGKLNILGAFDTINAPDFPFVYPQCALVCRIRFSIIEEGQHKIQINFMDDAGKNLIPQLDAKVNLKFPPSADSQVSNMILNMQGIKFPKHGRYFIDLTVDGDHKLSLPVFVNQIKKK